MKVIKFKINSSFYELFKAECIEENITVKNKLYQIHRFDEDADMMDEFNPEGYDEDLRSLTLKVNEDFFKSVTKKCYEWDLRLRAYMPYLIQKYLIEADLIQHKDQV